MSVTNDADKIVVKENRLFFDVYSILSILGILALSALVVYAIINYPFISGIVGNTGFIITSVLFSAIICFTLLTILSKDFLVIDKENILLGHSIPFLHIDAQVLSKDEIQAVDIGHNPTTGRYYLTVISRDKTIIFGKNMPIDDLRWIRSFVIRETVK